MTTAPPFDDASESRLLRQIMVDTAGPHWNTRELRKQIQTTRLPFGQPVTDVFSRVHAALERLGEVLDTDTADADSRRVRAVLSEDDRPVVCTAWARTDGPLTILALRAAAPRVSWLDRGKAAGRTLDRLVAALR
ncbi:hypothetical protein D5S17_05365 [Pseudonocardiaceae bacterium YIM PH 21723]|nr:hypothetical protein D5S17_05365 [Pseudonocardiaceae bacterium YIM PH 21723]